MSKTKLELTWIGKDKRPKLEPRILLEDPELSYHASHKVSENDIFDNKLIFGDNLLALKALEQEYTGKVKCIYIDPPYNTGQAFEHYDDGLENSIWLSLMRERLEVLWKLLKNDGYLAVQIDDKQFARLYLLMCEICLEQNLKTITVKMSEASGLKMSSVKKYGSIPKLKEYIVIAKKDGVKNLKLDPIPKEKWDSEYNIFLDNFSREDKSFIDEKSQQEEVSEKDLSQLDELASRIKLRSVADVVKELDLKGKEKDQWLFDNAFRICQCATSSSVLSLAEEKKQYNKQDLFFVKSKKGILYFVRANYSKDSKKPRLQLIFAEDNLTVHPGDLWTDFRTTGLEAEGQVSFKNGKKPEALVARVIKMGTHEGDLVLDSFGGSGTTAAVAHKMRRRWIVVELGEQCQTHILPRLERVIKGEDPAGITKITNWQGGGGFRYYKLAPSLIEYDRFGQPVINKEFNAEMLAEAVCKLEGFTYAPSDTLWWQHGYSTETDFIYVTTQNLSIEQLEQISEEVGSDKTLLVMCGAFRCKSDRFANLTIKKMPKAVLKHCEWAQDDYSLNVQNLPMAQKENEQQDPQQDDLF
ncbi:site-specific DNA-methyltransferase [Providencia stuartii]|uniref:site-specific DNA-methyltransferase n=1 Tax=Providencia stuartii TaxID=588 RepID=UPI00306EA154